MPARGARFAAKARGELHYLSGQLCRNGHAERRLVSTGQCLACLREHQARYADADRTGLNEKRRARYAKDPEIGRASCSRYYAKNKPRLVVYKQDYNASNRDRWNAIEADRLINDLAFHIKKALRARICSAIKRGTKTGSAVRDLGCTIEELRNYLAARFYGDMSWENWPTLWQIDHILPLSSFDLTDPKQFAVACHYSNLQPLLTDDHRRKTINDLSMLSGVSRPHP